MPHSLPDDVNRWPADPYELLGVARDADVKEIKRAYVQLLRKYRPDESPAEFQRLREAFEAASEYASFRAQFPSENGTVILRDDVLTDGDGRLGFREIPSQSNDDETLSSAKSKPPDAHTLTDRSPPAKSPWELAVAGESHAAWRMLEEQSRTFANPDAEEVVLQRYWLAKLTPGLSDRPPDDLLFEAVKKFGLTGRLWSLLMLEWNNNSERLLSPMVLDLLERPDGAERLVPLFTARWRAAGKASRWSLLEEDLVPLRRRLLPDHALVWLTILVEQMRFGAWRPESDSADRWQDSWLTELAQLGDLQLKASDQFDDAEQWHGLRQELLGPALAIANDSEIRDLLWSTTFEDQMAIKTRRAKLADTWRQQLAVALYELDTLATSRPITLMRFQHECLWLGSSFFSSPLADADPEAQRQMLQRTLRRILSKPPDEARLLVAAFCLQELMTVHEFCALANQHAPADWMDSIHLLTNHTANDLSLQCLCQMFRAVEFYDADIAFP